MCRDFGNLTKNVIFIFLLFLWTEVFMDALILTYRLSIVYKSEKISKMSGWS